MHPLVSVHFFGPPGLTERLRECPSSGRQSRARAGSRGRRAGPGRPRADALAGVVLHHLPRHLSQDTLSQRRRCGLWVGVMAVVVRNPSIRGRDRCGQGFRVASWALASFSGHPSGGRTGSDLGV